MFIKKKKKKAIGLNKQEQDAMIRVLSMGDQKLYVEILEDVQYLENVKYLTTIMKTEMTRNLEIEEIALALKLCSRDAIQSFLEDLSSTLIAEFKNTLATKAPFIKLREAQEKVKKYIWSREASGLFTFDPTKEDHLVE